MSWNEIKDRALRLSREWDDETDEQAEAKSFWDGFLNFFGVSRRRVKKLDGRDGYIDLLWKGVLLIEHKSRGKDLTGLIPAIAACMARLASCGCANESQCSSPPCCATKNQRCLRSTKSPMSTARLWNSAQDLAALRAPSDVHPMKYLTTSIKRP